MAVLTDVSCAKSGVILATGATAFEPTRAVYVDVTGSATFSFVNDSGTVAFTALPVGIYPFSVDKFTAGTATVIALY